VSRRELLEGQDLHMEAKETEELLDWIAAEAGLDEVRQIRMLWLYFRLC
jgi:hypothetical protein